MVGPARKREAVVHVRRSLEVSERRACRAILDNPEAPNATLSSALTWIRRCGRKS